MMTDTPRTDACIAENGDPVFKTSTGLAVLARQLERDLRAAQQLAEDCQRAQREAENNFTRYAANHAMELSQAQQRIRDLDIEVLSLRESRTCAEREAKELREELARIQNERTGGSQC